MTEWWWCISFGPKVTSVSPEAIKSKADDCGLRLLQQIQQKAFVSAKCCAFNVPIFTYKFSCLLIANTPSHVPAVFLFPGTEGDFGHVPGQAELQSVMFMSWHWAAHSQCCCHLLSFRRGRAGSCRDSRVVGIEEKWIIVYDFFFFVSPVHFEHYTYS